jgi:hypothetical protein
VAALVRWARKWVGVNAATGDDEFEERLVVTPCVRQCPITETSMIELSQGRRRGTGRVEYLLADATIREAEMQVCVVRSEWVEEADGSRWERPSVGLIAWAAHEAVEVERLPTAVEG